jgi:hypothetical protein
MMTQFTRDQMGFNDRPSKGDFPSRNPRRNYSNGKPYRSARLRAEAKATAYKGKDGTYHSAVATLIHPRVTVGDEVLRNNIHG